MNHYKITIKEQGNNKPIVSKYSGLLDDTGLIEFYGLNNSDVDWYKIEKL